METLSLFRILVKYGLGIGVVFLIVGGVLLWRWNHVATVVRQTGTGEVSFVLAKGDGAKEVAGKLKSAGLVDSEFPFLWYVMQHGLSNQLQSGEYRLSPAMTVSEMVQKMVEGKVVPPGVRITFPEGFTLAMMADKLNEAGLPGDDVRRIAFDPFPKWKEKYLFLKAVPTGRSLEGFLFPDTYIFPKMATGELIVNELLKTFEKKAQPLFAQYSGKTKLSPYESLILASILEEEGKNLPERKIISDIFLKRLAIGQPLQSDATVNYALGTSKMQPTLKDIESASPYNTYRNAGLPPTPIANPGLESLEAALSPTPNEYFYFLNNLNTGETVFSKTFEEHVANRQKHGL